MAFYSLIGMACPAIVDGIISLKKRTFGAQTTNAFEQRRFKHIHVHTSEISPNVSRVLYIARNNRLGKLRIKQFFASFMIASPRPKEN